MNRGKKALLNSVAGIVSQVVTMICGFILPRLIISSFGSSYNGITASISQFLSVSSLLFAGVGGATRASFYRSLAQKDDEQISRTVKATEIFMRRVAFIFLAIVAIFSLGYPFLVRNEFEWGFSASLVLIISLSTFVQYYFGYTYQILFQADQRQYVYALLGSLAIILNTVIAFVLIKLGVGIHGVKFGSTVAFCITPIALNILAKRYYHINKNAKPDFSSIGQRWDAFFHQFAWFIHSNTDITLLTIFTNTKEISVYTVYYLVANGLKSIMNSLIVGVEAAFGNLLANNEEDTLKKDVIHYEMMLHFFSSFLFGAALVLVTPFVQVYTAGVKDVNYTRYTFGYLAIIGEMLFILRSPYEALVNAAGHFKQTKKYAFLEMSINLVTSIIMIHFYGIVGVVVGTVVAIAIRNICYGVYASRQILHRKCWIFIRRFIISGLNIGCIFFATTILPKIEMISYFNWFLFALEVAIVSVFLTVLLNCVFYGTELRQMIKKLMNIVKSMVK